MGCVWNLPEKDRHCEYCGIQLCDSRYVDEKTVTRTVKEITEIIIRQIKQKNDGQDTLHSDPDKPDKKQ